MVPLIQPLFASLFSNAQEWLSVAWAIVQVIFGIGFLIFIHELGHFVVAKWAGVKVEMFSIGFGPTLLSWRRGFGLRRGSTVRDYAAKIMAVQDEAELTKVLEKYGETEYSLRILPLGGFVAWLGEDSKTESGGKSRDPRAFHNKPVGSRMAIVSAGVVMNLLFGVLCASWVHYKGKPETPAVIGTVLAGSPAYEAGMRPGDEVVAIDGRKDISFQDIIKATQLSRADQKIKFDLKRPGAKELIQVAIEPKVGVNASAPTIGVRPSDSLDIVGKNPQGLIADKDQYDHIRAVGPVGTTPKPVETIADLKTILAGNRDKPLVFEVERGAVVDRDTKPKTKVEVTIPPKKLVDFGLWMTMGPVTTIRPESPAALAGLRVGDVIVSIDGRTDFDPITLPELFESKDPKSFNVEVRRGKETVKLAVKPDATPISSEPTDPSEALEISPLGMAVRIEPKVAKVVEGSPAAKAKIAVGSVVSAVLFEAKELPDDLKKPMPIDGVKLAWPFVIEAIQEYDGPVKLTFGKDTSVSLTPVSLDNRYEVARGLHFSSLMRIHAPEPLGLALKKGASDALEMSTSILGLLRNLVTGRLGTNSVGGPVLISKLTYEIAKSGGIAELLPFLGFLSINLAVMNFFPIPPLDGGQMVFLVAEKVRGRPLPENAIAYPMIVGIVFIVILFVLVSLKDVLFVFALR